MQRGHLPLIYLACPTLVTTACSVGPNYTRPEARVAAAQRCGTRYNHGVASQIVADTMIKVCDCLAKRVSRRRGGRPVPHPSPVEAA
jgi:hypothetical protein